MASSIIRLSSGTIARLSDGSIAKIDMAAGPATLTCTHDWQVYNGSAWTSSPFTVTRSYATLTGNIGVAPYGYRGTVTFTVSLKMGSGRVRWEGTFDAYSLHIGVPNILGHVTATIIRNCPSGTVNPLGAYTVTGYTINNPLVPTSNYRIVEGSSIVLS